MRLLFIRHGETIANAEGRLQGQLDSPLTGRGREQARALAKRLKREGQAPSPIYASDLSRARETAEIVAAELEAPIVLDARLREFDAGLLTGLLEPEIKRLHPDTWHAFRHSPAWVPIPGGEGNAAFHARLVEALEEIEAKHEEGDVVAVVSHGGSLGMMLGHILGMDTRRPSPFHFGNASLTVLDLTERGPRVCLLNDISHLDGDLR
jgi:broad specificity phosphatase PhoE